MDPGHLHLHRPTSQHPVRIPTLQELWTLLHSANQTESHIPQQMLDAEAERQRVLRQQQEAVQVRG